MENDPKLENVVEIRTVVTEADDPKCYICAEAGVVSAAFHICRNPNCAKNHCVEHTSNVDFDKCSRCSEPVEISVTKLSKTTSEYDELRDEILTETHTAKSIHFNGEHWLSNSVIIGSMNDSQLKAALEYNKAMVKMIEEELLHRKIAKSKAHLSSTPFAGKRFVKATTSVETTKTKKTRQKRTAVSDADKIMAILGKGGLDASKLLELLQKKVQGGK